MKMADRGIERLPTLRSLVDTKRSTASASRDDNNSAGIVSCTIAQARGVRVCTGEEQIKNTVPAESTGAVADFYIAE